LEQISNPEVAERIRSLLASPELVRMLKESKIEPAFAKQCLEAAEHAKLAPPDGLFPRLPVDSNDDVRTLDRPIVPCLGDSRNLNADAFVAALHSDLAPLPIGGYTLRLRRDGITTHTMSWNWARRAQNPLKLEWRPTVKMHVASISKMITAMAVVKLLRINGLPYDTLVGPYLPEYLTVGQNLSGLTFRHLLSHTSGWRQVSDEGLNDGYDYAQFKALYSTGVDRADVGQYGYHNGNYIALRVAMSILSGRHSRDDFTRNFPATNAFADLFWDTSSTAEYVRYVRENIFIPSFTQATLTPANKDSLAYSLNLSKTGVAMSALPNAGTAGWWLSAEEVVSIMNAFWQSNAIVPRSVARRALREGVVCEAPLGFQFHRGQPDCFIKGGYWSDGDKRTNQCIAVFAPRNVEIAVFVNSPIPNNTIVGMVTRRLAENLS
jgi:Beta-lactamase